MAATQAFAAPIDANQQAQRRHLLAVIVLALFVIGATVIHSDAVGGDLATSYFGCQVVLTHQPQHLFSRDKADYASIHDPVWTALAQKQNYAPKRLHPYVQIPLWAYSLEPFCQHLNFVRFRLFFLFLANLCVAGILWIVARFWAPRLYHPGWLAAICLAVLLSAPYGSAIALVQTHLLFVLLTLLALAFAVKRPFLAGACLAVAAAVKITPALFLLYWLMLRRWRAAACFLICTLAILILNLLLAGWPLTHSYLQSLSAISNMLLVSADNQSLAAWWMQHHYAFAETQAWHALPLSNLVKLTSVVLTLSCVLLGGILDRHLLNTPDQEPFGAALALIGLTIFAAIAWDHYFVLLVFPLMLLLDTGLARRSAWLLVSVIAIGALNFDLRNFAGLALRMQSLGLVPPLRAQFFSAVLCLAALLLAALTTPEHRKKLPILIR